MTDRGLPAPQSLSAHRPDTAETWAGWTTGWHLAFWLLMALAALRLLVGGDLTRGQQVGGLGVTAAMALTYLLTVHGPWTGDGYRRAHPEHGSRSGQSPAEGARGSCSGPEPRWRYVYLVVAVLGTGVACSLDSSLSLLLFIVYPQTWMLTRSRRSGAGFTVALTASSTVGFLGHYGGNVDVLPSIGPQMLVSLLFSVLLGMWIWRVVEQSTERGELIAALEATRGELAEAHHTRGVIAERERLAREIHDTLAQGLTSIVMLAQAASAGLPGHPERVAGQLAAIEDVARENLAEARAVVAAYTPVALDGSTLADAVRRLVERFERETGLRVELQIGTGMIGLSRAQEVVALRTAQEALTNVRRHARAHRVTVRLLADGGGARVEVGDDGVGLGAASDATAPGFGLAGIRSRVSEVGGQLAVDSAPGRGTRVTVLLPRQPGDEPVPDEEATA